MSGYPTIINSLQHAIIGAMEQAGIDRSKAEVVAEDGAMRFLAEHSGDEVYIPAISKLQNADRNRRIRKARKSGVSAATLAEQYNLSTRCIHRICSGS